MDEIRDEAVMRRFLLGQTQPEQTDRIERELADDPAYFEEMCALEDDVALQYHRGELPSADREQFERHVLSSPARARHVEQLRAVRDALVEQPTKGPRAIPTSTRLWLMAACMAAALIGWIIWYPSSPSSPSAVLATFVLTDGQVRSGGGDRNVFREVSGDGDIQLEITVPFPSVVTPSARLRRVGDATLPWSADARVRHADERSSTLTWRVPARTLAPGDYILNVTDETTPGTSVPLASAFFRIVP